MDLSRHNARNMYYRDIIDIQNLVYTFDLPYYDMSNNNKSCINHFSVHSSLCDSVSNVKRCECALNPSKYLPLLLDICVNTTRRDIGAEEGLQSAGIELMTTMRDSTNGNSNRFLQICETMMWPCVMM